MTNQNSLRALSLAVLALVFSAAALRLPMGHLSRPGPGLFPILVSGLLLGISLLMVLQARLLPPVPIRLGVKNAVVVFLSLVAFVAAARWLGMAAAIVVLVFGAALASRPYSWMRNATIAIALLGVAAAFQTLLGLNLKLF